MINFVRHVVTEIPRTEEAAAARAAGGTAAVDAFGAQCAMVLMVRMLSLAWP